MKENPSAARDIYAPQETGALLDDLAVHIALENDVLFPRFRRQ